jgi:hypothetical protein
MAAYNPQNINVFAAAFAAVMASAPSSGLLVDTTQADYSGYAAIASAFAQAVDTSWGANPASQYEVNCIATACAAYWTDRNPSPSTSAALQTAANHTPIANAIVAMTKAGDTQLVANQITSPQFGGANRAYGSGSATTAGQATITVIAAAKLIAKSSGIFKAWCSFSYAAAAAADVITVTMKVFTDAVAGTPLTLGNVGQIGFGSNGVAQPGNVAVNNNGAFTSNAGAGITITGGSAGFTTDTKVETIGTAAAGAFYAWENEVGVALSVAGNENPIPIGQTCLVTLSVTNSAAARATGNINIGLFEMAA